MKLFCPDCGSSIAAADINLDHLAAKCAACATVFSFETALDASPQRRPAEPAAPLLPRPARMTIDDTGATWSLSFRWFKPAILGLLFFCIFWDGFLLFWYKTAFSEKHINWTMVLFPLLHVTVGVALTYTVIASFVNRTTMSFSAGTLNIRHGPLPWLGNRTLHATDVQDLRVEKGKVQRNHSNLWNLVAMRRDGSKLKLLSGFDEYEDLNYIEQQLRMRLRLA